MSNRPAYGYVLVSSRDEDAFGYYGITIDPCSRLQTHLSGARKFARGKGSSNRWKDGWIASEIAAGYELKIVVLHQYPDETSAYTEENDQITLLRRVGYRLRNIAPGGRGTSNTETYTAEMRSVFTKRSWQDDDVRSSRSTNISLTRGTDESRAKTSKQQRALWANRSEEERSAFIYSTFRSPESLAKIAKTKSAPEWSVAHRKRQTIALSSAETRMKMRLSNRYNREFAACREDSFRHARDLGRLVATLGCAKVSISA